MQRVCSLRSDGSIQSQSLEPSRARLHIPNPVPPDLDPLDTEIDSREVIGVCEGIGGGAQSWALLGFDLRGSLGLQRQQPILGPCIQGIKVQRPLIIPPGPNAISFPPVEVTQECPDLGRFPDPEPGGIVRLERDQPPINGSRQALEAESGLFTAACPQSEPGKAETERRILCARTG